MSAVTEAGFGMQPRTSARVSQSLRLWLFDLPIAKVSASLPPLELSSVSEQYYLDANLFKEAFFKAQQDNEALFTKDAGE